MSSVSWYVHPISAGGARHKTEDTAMSNGYEVISDLIELYRQPERSFGLDVSVSDFTDGSSAIVVAKIDYNGEAWGNTVSAFPDDNVVKVVVDTKDGIIAEASFIGMPASVIIDVIKASL